MKRPARLLVATGNAGKLAEMRELLAGAGIGVVSPAEAGWNPDVPETGATLEENATLKARAGAVATGLPTLADDTGLFVDALGGAPGVRSARYAGEAQDPAANCARLLAALSGVAGKDRAAAFRCVVVLASPDGELRAFTGETRGSIGDAPRGDSGFGYDPLFVSAETGRTFAEMDSAAKHRVSHRGRALTAVRDFLDALSDKEST